jgi:hypothetical protein
MRVTGYVAHTGQMRYKSKIPVRLTLKGIGPLGNPMRMWTLNIIVTH